MLDTKGWIAGMATVAALALTAQAVNDIIGEPADYGPLAVEQDRAIIDLRHRLHLAETTAEARMDGLEMQIDAVRTWIHTEQEKVRLQTEREKVRLQELKGSDRASLFQSARKAEEEAPLTANAPLEGEMRKTAERYLIEADTERYRQQQRVEALKQLLVEHGIDHEEAEIESGPKVVSAPSSSLDDISREDFATAEAWVRGLVERGIADAEADTARLKRMANKLEAVLIENGIDPKNGGKTDG